MMARSAMLQRKAGYIDARPLTAELVELSCNARPDYTFGSIATGGAKLQVQPCPQCPFSDGGPEKGGLS